VEVCGFGNVSVNGHRLSTEGSSPISGQDAFLVRGAGDRLERSLTASWHFDCLYDIYNYSRREGNEERPIAQALMFQFLTIDDAYSVDDSSGFTFSFTQSPDAELVRLDTRLWPSGPFLANEWSDLDYLRLSQMFSGRSPLPPGSDAALDPPSTPQPCPREKGTPLGKELKQCQTIKCALKAISHKAQGAVKTIYRKVCPPPPCGKESGELEGTYRSWKEGTHQSFQEWQNQGWRNQGSGHGDSQGPPPLHGHSSRHGLRKTAKILIAILLFAPLIFTLYVTIRKCCSCYSAKRCRIRREARAARRAARREAWRLWWQKYFHRRPSIEDSEEKRARVRPQEAILENAMQSEIRGLREAADMVSNLIAAEEGRGQLRRTHSFGSEASLPSYRSQASVAGDEPPPGYDENGADDVVVDGFQYTPSATTWTPESSVIGSPRMRFDDSDEHDDDI
jgi:hypothetical protein